MAAALTLLLIPFFLFASSNAINVVTTSVELSEDLKVGQYAFTIEAHSPAGPVRFKITGENAFYFSVNEMTGNVTLQSQLNREETQTIKIDVSFSDPEITISRLITVIVLDANDNKPIFDPASYEIYVKENTPLNLVLFQVKATDKDINEAGSIVYSIDNVIPSSGINVFSISGITGNVNLTESLNFISKSNFYQLKIKATDKGGTFNGTFAYQYNVAYASVNVIDVPDLDPVFLNVPYSATVNEQTPVGSFVFRASAIDPDFGVNDIIHYSLRKSNVPDLFSINESTGDITVKTLFDREALLDVNATVILSVMATEANENILGVLASNLTDVTITIGDINDNKPKFYHCDATPCHFTTEATDFISDITEHSSVGVSVTGLNMSVVDLDQGKNAVFSLYLEGPDKDVFSVSPSTATGETQVQIQVKNPQGVDFEEKKVMMVEVVATDVAISEFRSMASVTIHIKDINDNPPTFQKDIYHVEVDEHTANGSIIANITAVDPDTEDVDNITYRLLPDSILKYFNVEPKTGSIKVANEELLDREATPFLYATLQATDRSGKAGRTNLDITLLDINDMTPVIPTEYYNEFTKEGPDQKLSFQIQATDRDEGENSMIRYRINPSNFSGNFTIDPDTGVLQNNGQLDREAIDPSLNGVIELNVTATDMGLPPRATWVKVKVNVDDINDNRPEFRHEAYAFHVTESFTGPFVGSVFAHDADQTEINNRISFRITDGSFGNFIVITSADENGGFVGNISVDPDVELDYERGRRLYNLKIEATDLGNQKATVEVKVNVLDVNDERPVFPKDVLLHVHENTTGLGQVGQIEGEDPDSNHSLIYELISMQCHCNETTGPCDEDWFIMESTGAITVNEEFVIDFEKCDQVVLEAQVVDVFTEKGENCSLPGSVIIKIDDINDNNPIFLSSDGVFVVVSEDTDIDTSVAALHAYDLDSGDNRVIDFDILSVEFVNTNNDTILMDKKFKAVKTAENNFYKATIRCLGSLDSTLKGKYLVTVEAKDKGGLTATNLIEIYTIDKSYRVVLRFESSVADVNANRNQIEGALRTATGAAVRILEIVAENVEQRDLEMRTKGTDQSAKAAPADTKEGKAKEITLLGAYFIYANGSAMSSSSVERVLQEDLYHANILRKYGLTHIDVSGGALAKEVNPVFLVLIGLVAALGIVLVVMITSLICTQKSYKTKLKAAKAMNTAMNAATESRKTGDVMPGTNKYMLEGANPVLNVNIDVATELGFDEDGSSTDKASLDSLDIDMTDKDDVPMMAIEEEDENVDESHLSYKYIEPLGAALAQRNKNKEPKSPQGYTNPVFNTTDL